MINFKKRFSSFLFLSIFSLSVITAQSTYAIENPEQLSKTNIDINSNWDFYWGKFVTPQDITTIPDAVVSAPSEWNKYPLSEENLEIAKTGKGCGTYRLKITNLKPGQKYVFPVYKLAYTAFTIFANTKLIYQSGIPSENWNTTISKQFFDTAAFTADQNGSVILTIFVSNNFYRKGGLRGTLKLYEEKVYQNFYFRTLTNYAIFSGILLMIAVYCLINFILKKDKSSLYLALLIMAVFSRLASSSFPIIKTLIPDLPFTILLRMEYIAMFFIPGFLTLYIDTLNKFIFRKIPAILISAPSFVFFILDLVLPIHILNSAVPVMQVYMYTSLKTATLLQPSALYLF